MSTPQPIPESIRANAKAWFGVSPETLQLFRARVYALDHNTLATEHMLMSAFLMKLQRESPRPLRGAVATILKWNSLTNPEHS